MLVCANIMALEEPNSQKQVMGRKGDEPVPLTMIGAGEERPILRIGGSESVRAHLENLGFVAGERVRVVSDIAGNLIVQVKEARIAISRELAMKILV